MSDNAAAEPSAPRIPSAWMLEAKLSDAMRFLAENDDICSEVDIALALESEHPDALALIDAYAAAALSLGDHAQRMRERARLLGARAAARESQEERLRDQLAQIMQALNLKHRHTPSGTVSLKRVPGRVHVTDERAIPLSYCRQTTKIEPDKSLIARAISEGKDIPGVAMGNERVGIQIK